ncbi:MAG TPA: cytochrome d ubiquinol oxidase subunit II [Gemmatimonadaceae bacterium]|nr:cytochrome d ubiquinol oxidase subunit II [Gemmatimonadaceae bacterium]
MDAASLPLVHAMVIAIALNAYVLTGGADFGGGVWDLLASGPRREQQRETVAKAIGPIWEANHVWLILVVVVLFTAFPPAFAAISIVLHVPLTLLLLGIVLRGAAFVFRSYGSPADAAQRRWGRVFAIASVVTPVFLGICVGAIVSGAVGERLALVRSGAAGFAAVYVRPWLAPFPLAVGALTLALFAFLAAVYLTLEAKDAEVREDFRRRALAAAAVAAVTALLGVVAGRWGAPRLQAALLSSAGGILLLLAAALALATAAWCLWTRRWALARVAAAALVSLVLWGWVYAQNPMLVPPALDVHQAASPPATLRLLLWALIGGAVILAPSLLYLYRLFSPTAPRR